MEQRLDRRAYGALMISMAPSVQKVRFHVEHALDCFETLKDHPGCSSKVQTILRDLLAYLANFDEGNDVRVSGLWKLVDGVWEKAASGELDVDVADAVKVESAPFLSRSDLSPVKEDI